MKASPSPVPAPVMARTPPASAGCGLSATTSAAASRAPRARIRLLETQLRHPVRLARHPGQPALGSANVACNQLHDYWPAVRRLVFRQRLLSALVEASRLATGASACSSGRMRLGRGLAGSTPPP